MSFFRLWHLVFFLLIGLQVTPSFSSSKPNFDSASNIPGISGEIYKVLETNHFNLIYSTEITENEKIASLLELSYIHFQSLFREYNFETEIPKQKLKWLTFTNKDSFNLYAFNTENQDLSWLNGYYSAKTNAVAIVSPQKISKWRIQPEDTLTLHIIACPPDAETGLAKIVHEAAHQLSFNTGLQKRKVMYPFWISEGLATFFEQSMFEEYFQSSRYASIRKRGLIALYSRKKLIPLDKFISMTSLDNDISPVDAYAQAWGLFRFLIENHRNSLKKYLLDFYKLEPGWIDSQTLSNEFIESIGSPEVLNPQWTKFIEQLSS